MLNYWIVDAFTDEPFKGNPAAVVLLDKELPDTLLQNFAKEFNLAETAYPLKTQTGYHLRWFTTSGEMDLCGHATLSAAHIIFTETDWAEDTIKFTTNVAGELIVKKENDFYSLDFPSRPGEAVALKDLPPVVLNALKNLEIVEARKARDLMLILGSEKEVRNMKPDFSALQKYEPSIIVTAPADQGRDYDYVSRHLCANDIPQEDPVTGSAQCTLMPYWAKRFGKKNLTAYQASERGGYLYCEDKGERILIKGKALTMMNGTIRTKLSA